MVMIALQLIAGVALLYYGAEFLIRGGVSIATRLGITPLVIGLTLVAFATSAPELVVSVQAALNGTGDICVGNVVGSNICNIALILGISALITPLAVNLKILRFDLPMLLLATLAMAAIGLGTGEFGRLGGVVFLAALIAYTVWNVRSARRETAAGGGEEPGKVFPLHVSIFFAAGGIVALVLGGKLMVDGAVALGTKAGLSEAVIGLTIVAVGTSLPELATSVVAACRGQQDIAIGNVVGSNLFNILGIMGIAPLLRPVSAVNISIVDWSMLVLTALLLLPFMRSGFRISRREGGVLLLIYIGYLVYLAVNA